MKNQETIISYEHYKEICKGEIDKYREAGNKMDEEKRDTRNINESEKYLKANGLDTSIAETPYFAEKFKIDRDDGTRYFVYYEDAENIISGHNRDQTEHHTKKSNFRIKKMGKAIILEEIYTSEPKIVHYGKYDPMGKDYNRRKVPIEKITTFIDEQGEYELVQEVRSYTADYEEYSTDMPTENRLYSGFEKVEYKVNEENVKKVMNGDYDSETPGGYQPVQYIRNIANLQNKNKELEEQNKENLKRLAKAVNFAEKVKSSRLGRLFFGRSIKALDEPMDDREI